MKVSIIIPVFNGSNYLKQAIDCALKQTYKNIEVIVVNDGSTDNGETEKIAKSYGDKIKYYYKENGGVSSALNYGIKKMSGELFSWLSHDDLYYPTKIEEEVNLYNEHHGMVIVFSNYNYIDELGNLIEEIDISKKLISTNAKYVFYKRMISGISLLIPKKFLVNCGYFDTNLKCTQDYDMWYKLIKKYDFVYLNSYTVSVRLHPNQDSVRRDYIVDENEKFWRNVIKDIDEKTIKSIFLNEYNFYIEIYHTLKYSNYDGLKKDLRDKLFNDYFENMVDEIIASRTEHLTSMSELDIIKKENRELKQNYDGIVNSKSWKLASSFIRLKQLITIRKEK